MPKTTPSPADKSRLDGHDLRAMFSAATALFERNVAAINALNVFPVPDGDTGTNMFLTLQAVVEKANGVPGGSADAMADAMANGALMGARGNSGVILSQFFRGMAVGLKGSSDFGTAELAAAFRAASDHAYKAVGNPVEGTLLTVIRNAAEAAEATDGPEVTLSDFYDAVLLAARDSVARTPTMLDVLREAGVVDAGGQGLAVLLEGTARWVRGDETALAEIAAPEAVGVEGASGKVSFEFIEATDEELYGYCTQFLIQGEGLDTDGIRERMEVLASSTVVVGDGAIVRVHVHAEDPGPVLSAAVAHGMLAQVNIRNMDEQHAEFSELRRTETPPAPLAVVAVAMGNGIEELFAGLGAARIVTGGNTMNPSVKDLVDAVNEAPSDNVIVLPNNRNIVPAAEQAAELSQKQVKVVASKSIPQGVAAILALSPDGGLEDNVAAMAEALVEVRTGEVTAAVRSATINRVPVRPGQLIGLLEHELVVSGEEAGDVTSALLEKAGVGDGELVTLYWGAPLGEEEATAVFDRLTAGFPDAEIELVRGGQPHYHFLISIE